MKHMIKTKGREYWRIGLAVYADLLCICYNKEAIRF